MDLVTGFSQHRGRNGRSQAPRVCSELVVAMHASNGRHPITALPVSCYNNNKRYIHNYCLQHAAAIGRLR